MRNSILLIALTFVFSLNTSVAEMKAETFSKIQLKNPVLFKINIIQRCMLGDFDALSLDMQYGFRSKIRLSIQNFEGKEVAGSYIFTKLNDAKGKEAIKQGKLILKEGEKAQILSKSVLSDGLYTVRLCKTSDRRTNCEGLEAKPINDILDLYSKPPSHYLSEDNLYFLQPIFIKDGKIFAFNRTINENYSKPALTALAKEGLTPSEQAYELLLEASTLESYPLELFTSEIVINLPMYSAVKCGK